MYIDLYYVYLYIYIYSSFLKHPSWCRISSIYSTLFGGVIFGILFTKPILESLSMMYWSIFLFGICLVLIDTYRCCLTYKSETFLTSRKYYLMLHTVRKIEMRIGTLLLSLDQI